MGKNKIPTPIGTGTLGREVVRARPSKISKQVSRIVKFCKDILNMVFYNLQKFQSFRFSILGIMVKNVEFSKNADFSRFFEYNFWTAESTILKLMEELDKTMKDIRKKFRESMLSLFGTFMTARPNVSAPKRPQHQDNHFNKNIFKIKNFKNIL